MIVRFSQKEKLKHYDAVAKGKAKVKKNSKFSKKEQESYARGQADARKEQMRLYAMKNATPEQRKAYSEKRRAQREQWKREHPERGIKC